MSDKTDNRFYREAGEINPHACREGFEQQRKAGINVDWFTWQIAWHDAMFTQADTKPASQPKALTAEQIDAIMEQAQVFASAWSLVGGVFDSGDALVNAHQEKDDLRNMLNAFLEASK
jgi:hypothetical protein